MCLQALKGQDKHPPVKSHTWTLAWLRTNTHKEKKKNGKDARWFIMSTCSGVVIFKMSVRHVFALPHLISASFIPNSDYLGVSTSDLIGE